MKFTALVGSLRHDSYNLGLVNTIRERYHNNFTLELANISILPHFNQDEEHSPPEVVKQFKRQLTESNGLIIATPEYN